MIVTLWCFSDAWITRTRDLPGGVVSSSWRICSRSPLAGPMPATVYAPPGAMRTLVDSTGAAHGHRVLARGDLLVGRDGAVADVVEHDHGVGVAERVQINVHRGRV